MANPADVVSELRVGDLKTFLAVKRSGSVSTAAREQGVTPSQVSKAISRLENILHVRLFSRGARGVALSDQARLVLPHIEAAVASLQLLERPEKSTATQLTVAAPSYLISSFLPCVACCLPQLQVRGLSWRRPSFGRTRRRTSSRWPSCRAPRTGCRPPGSA